MCYKIAKWINSEQPLLRFILFPPLLLLLVPFLLIADEGHKTHFFYSEKEMQRVEHLDSQNLITEESLKKWDQLLSKYLKNKPSGVAENVLRIFTYLYTAQKDFAFLSKQMHGDFKGSIDPISLEVIRFFYPFFPLPRQWEVDEYSIVLAEMVLEKLKQRFKEEKAAERTLSISHWTSQVPDFGKNILSWGTWVVPSITLKTTAAPPSSQSTDFWKKQIDEVRKANENISQEQKEIVRYWGNFFDPEGGDWIEITNKYLFSHTIDLETIINVRSLATMAMYDSLIVAFEAKYTFTIIAPYVADKNIKIFIKKLYYPSYPSVHSAISYAAATVLSHFFPEHKLKWELLAEESGQSRIWAGMNYPIDVVAGKEIGTKVADHVLET